MKTWSDRKARDHSFQSGDKVLLFLPVRGTPLQGRYSGPYIVDKKINDVDYIIHTPDRCKSKRLCHINLLKAYNARDDVKSVWLNVNQINQQVLHIPLIVTLNL